MTNLVIVESAAKAKTIAGYLNSIPELKHLGKFNVIACFGHICDLPSKELGVNTDTWEVSYQPLDTKKDIIAKLRKGVKEATKIYLCSDLDMEGHAISFHLKNILKLKRADYERVVFNEITKTALKNAFLNPGDIDMNMVNAQETRRILDRVVGYKLSPVLWDHFSQSKLSAGRVQSAALNLIVDRYKQLTDHTAEVYWDIYGTFDFTELLHDLKLDVEYRIDIEEDVVKIMNNLKIIGEWIATFKKKKSQKNPPVPFITSSLQQEVYQRYHIPAKRTMQIAQNLYELGLITYMRTDSPSLSQDCQKSIHNYLEETYDSTIITERNYEGKDGAQEAHESIHPTDISVTVDNMPDNETITDNHKKIYDLIWRRTVASQMSAAIYTDITVTVTGDEYIFTGKISILIDKGFMKVYNPDTKLDPKLLETWTKIMELKKVNAIKFNAIADATKTQSLYNEPGLIKALEKENIGRPSTYATIIDKVYDKGYVALGQTPQTVIKSKNYEVKMIDGVLNTENTKLEIGGKEKDRMIPTELGINIIEYLKTIIPYLLDVKFTSEMEDSLDKIATNKLEKLKVLGEFYDKFKKNIPEIVNKPMSEAKALQEYPNLEANIVNTKYGPAIYDKKNKKFHSLKPYLDWKKVEMKDLSEDDVRFLISFPIKTAGTKREIHIGQYGLYIKDKSENIKMPNYLWDKVRDANITKDEIDAIKKTVWKKPQ